MQLRVELLFGNVYEGLNSIEAVHDKYICACMLTRDKNDKITSRNINFSHTCIFMNQSYP